MSKAVKTVKPADKAKKVANAIKAPVRFSKRKVYTKVQFRRPHSRSGTTKPKYARTLHANEPTTPNHYAIVKEPVFSDATMKLIEEHNTLTFIVDSYANKFQIKQAVQALYNAKVVSVNTLIRPDGKKKAYCRLHPDTEALQVASAIGLV